MDFFYSAAIRRSTVRFSGEKRYGAVIGETQDSGGKTKANQETKRKQKPSEEMPGQHTT